MRIAIASDNESAIAAHTGRCGGFVVYDIVDGVPTKVGYRSNTFTAHGQGQCSGEGSHGGDAGHHHSHQPLLDALGDCQALVTRGMGPRLVADLAARDITPYVCGVGDVDEAARLFAEGRLPRMAGSGPCCRH